MLSFLPDADPRMDGVLTRVVNCVPTLRGYAAAGEPVSTGADALVSDALYCASVSLLDGQTRTLAATETDIYELAGDNWASRITALNASADTGWSMCQFGNATIAANGADSLLAAVGVASSFSVISGAPSAAIVTTVSPGFVMAFDTDDGTDAFPDGWWCSALRDHTDWTPSVTTQCANNRLLDTPGRITAGKAIGDGVVAYKLRSMHFGQYVGGDVIWSWNGIVGNAGCVGKHAVVDAGGVHYFVGVDDLWMYDGSQPQAIGEGIKEWFFSKVDPSRMHLITGVYDRERSHVLFFCPTSSSAALGFALVYHIPTRRWGYIERPCSTAFAFQKPAVPVDSMDMTFDELPDIPYDSPYWQGGQGTQVAVITQELATLTGTPASSTIMTGDFGNNTGATLLRKVVPHWSQEPSAATMQHFFRSGSGVDLTIGATKPMKDHKFNFLRRARWHRLLLDMTGPHELTNLEPELLGDGAR